MALNTRTAFGRALNFARANPLPLWKDGANNEFPWGWWSPSGGTAATIIPQFGPPFLDVRSLIASTIGIEAHLLQFLGRRARIKSVLEVRSKIPSPRISRSVKNG